MEVDSGSVLQIEYLNIFKELHYAIPIDSQLMDTKRTRTLYVALEAGNELGESFVTFYPPLNAKSLYKYTIKESWYVQVIPTDGETSIAMTNR